MRFRRQVMRILRPSYGLSIAVRGAPFARVLGAHDDTNDRSDLGDGSLDRRWPKYSRSIAIAVAASIICIGGLWLWFDEDSPEPPEDQADSVAFEAYERMEKEVLNESSGSDAPTDETTPKERIVHRAQHEQTLAGDDKTTAEMIEETSKIGPRRWMAEADDVDVEALENRLRDSEMDQQFELMLRRDRRSSIDVADETIRQCYAEREETRSPDDRGSPDRIAVEWKISTDAGDGRINNPRILHQLGPPDQQFERCVLDGLDGLQFEAVGDGGDLLVRQAFYGR